MNAEPLHLFRCFDRTVEFIGVPKHDAAAFDTLDAESGPKRGRSMHLRSAMTEMRQ